MCLTFQGCWATILLLLLPACLTEVHAQQPPTTTEFTPTQYHIQTDDGDRRFFKYQTWSGQVRKEDRLDDGTVVGSYGWVDANGILRLYDYVADNKGYRIVKTRLVDVKKQQSIDGDDVLLPTPTTPTFEASKRSKVPIAIVNPRAEVVRPTQVDDAFERHNVIDDSPATSSRLQRRISGHQGGGSITVNVQPLFDVVVDDAAEPTPLSTPPTTLRTTPTRNLFEARGEGFRTQFNPAVVNDPVSLDSIDTFGPKPVARSRSEDGRQFVVVKRRRPNAIGQSNAGAVELDYQTNRAFHHEEQLVDGRREGQFGYIDPIGVRRVVNYATGDNGEIVKSKENDYVGTDTYFQAS